jgi:pimeloyl-ACP methyl ester carboxylesterase
MVRFFSPLRSLADRPDERAVASARMERRAAWSRASSSSAQLGRRLEGGELGRVEDLVGVGVAHPGDEGLGGEGVLDGPRSRGQDGAEGGGDRRRGREGSGPREARGSTSSGWWTTQRARRFSVPISVTSKPGEGAKSSPGEADAERYGGPARTGLGGRKSVPPLDPAPPGQVDDQPETVEVEAEELAPAGAGGDPAAFEGVEGRVEGLQGGDGPQLAALDQPSRGSGRRGTRPGPGPREARAPSHDADPSSVRRRPATVALVSGRATDGRSGDGTVGAVEVGAQRRGRPVAGRPRGHGVGAGGGRMRDDGPTAVVSGGDQNEPVPDVQRRPDQHDHDDRSHRVRGAGGLVGVRGRPPVRIGDGPSQLRRSPNGRTIKIALEMRPAEDPSERIGSLVINPGGPGTSGIDDLPNELSVLTPELLDRFDIVSFDPEGGGTKRPGVVRSVPLHHEHHDDDARHRTTDGRSGQSRSRRAGGREGGAGAGQGLRRGLQAVQRMGILAYVGTVDAAQDLDRIRAALGDAKLTFIGHSYGTLLGATYAEMYPGHVRAMVLDGAIDPALSTDQMVIDQAQGFESVLDDFFSWCASTASCPWRTTWAIRPPPSSRSSTPAARRTSPAATGGSAGPGSSTTPCSTTSTPGRRGRRSATPWPRRPPGNGTDLISVCRPATPVGGRPTAPTPTTPSTASTTRCPTHAVVLSVRLAATAAAQAPVFGPVLAWGLLQCAVWPVPPTRTPAPDHRRRRPPHPGHGDDGGSGHALCSGPSPWPTSSSTASW